MQHGGAAVAFEVFAVNEGDGDFGAVACRYPDALGGVVTGVVTGYGLLFELAAFAGFDVGFIDDGRGGERGVAVAQPVAVRLRVGRDAHGVGRFVRFQVFAAAVFFDDADAVEAVRALADGGVVSKGLEVFEVNRRIVCDPFLPVGAGGGVVARGHEFEVCRAVGVGADNPAVAVVVGIVFEVALARGQHFECAGVCRRGVAQFVRDGAAGADGEVFFVAGAADAEVVAVVAFFVHHGVGFRVAAEGVFFHPFAEQGVGVVFNVVEGLAVVRPDGITVGAGDFVGKALAAREVGDAQGVLAAAIGVIRPEQFLVVLADVHHARAVVIVSFGKHIDVEQDFFADKIAAVVRRLDADGVQPGAVGAAGIDGVIFAGFKAGVVPVTTVTRGHGAVVLFDAGDNFVIELVFLRFQRREDGIGVGVFRVEIGKHLRVFAFVVAQPVILVLPLAVRRGDGMWAFFNIGRGLGVEGGHGQYQGEEEGFEVHGCLVVEMRGA